MADNEDYIDPLMEKELPEVAMTDVEKSGEDKTVDDSAAEWKESDIIRNLEMYLSFCSKHHDFLDE